MTQPREIPLNIVRYTRGKKYKKYKVQEISRIDSVSFVKIPEKITCKRVYMYAKTKYQNEAVQWQDDNIN